MIDWLYHKQTDEETKLILKYINNNNIEGWYKLACWKQLRTRILEYYHYECYDCRKRGRITTRPNRLHIHHEYHILNGNNYLHALEPFVYIDNEYKQNLFVLCSSCHMNRHEEKLIKANEILNELNEKKKNNWINEERW